MQEDDEDTTDVDESTMLTPAAKSLKTFLNGWGMAAEKIRAKANQDRC